MWQALCQVWSFYVKTQKSYKSSSYIDLCASYIIVPIATSLQSGKSRFFELRLLCYLHPWNTAQRQPNYRKRSLRCSGTFCEHFLPIKNGRFCAGFGQSLRVLSWPFCCLRTSPLGLEDLLLMFWCYIMLVHVVRNRLVLILLKSVPLFM